MIPRIPSLIPGVQIEELGSDERITLECRLCGEEFETTTKLAFKRASKWTRQCGSCLQSEI